jgi:hypothetical protein
MALAAHHPERVRPEHRGVLRMTLGQLNEFAKTARARLPRRVRKGR